jgi:hypothetical protein
MSRDFLDRAPHAVHKTKQAEVAIETETILMIHVQAGGVSCHNVWQPLLLHAFSAGSNQANSAMALLED